MSNFTLYRKPKRRDYIDHYDLIDRCRACPYRHQPDQRLACDCMVVAVGVRPLRAFVDLDDDKLWEMRSVRDGREPWRGRR